MTKSNEELLREMARLAAINKVAVEKALGKESKDEVNPYVVYAKPSQR